MTAFERLIAWRWPDGEITCPKCGTEAPYFISTREQFHCANADCSHHFSPTSDTPFASNKLGCDGLVRAVDLINEYEDISVRKLAGLLGMSYKGASYLVKRVRAEGVRF